VHPSGSGLYDTILEPCFLTALAQNVYRMVSSLTFKNVKIRCGEFGDIMQHRTNIHINIIIIIIIIIIQ